MEAKAEHGRWCGICEASSMRHAGDKSLTAGMSEQTWACASCGTEVAFLGAGSRLILWALCVALTIGWLVGLAVGRVKAGDEVAISVLMAALVGGLAVIAIRSARADRRHPAGEFAKAYRQTSAPAPDPVDPYAPPTLRDRLTHPFSIFGFVVVLAVAGLWGWRALERREAAALRQRVEALGEQWEPLRQRGVERMSQIAAALDVADAPAGACLDVAGTLEVVDRPVLEALAAGERFARSRNPFWLNTSAFSYLAGIAGPGMNPSMHRERLDVVSRMVAASCVGVFDASVANQAEVVDGSALHGGDVVGELSIVCPGPQARRCSTQLTSQPTIAIVVVHKDASAQEWADRDALRHSASEAYRLALVEALSRLAPRASLAAD